MKENLPLEIWEDILFHVNVFDLQSVFNSSKYFMDIWMYSRRLRELVEFYYQPNYLDIYSAYSFCLYGWLDKNRVPKVNIHYNHHLGPCFEKEWNPIPIYVGSKNKTTEKSSLFSKCYKPLNYPCRAIYTYIYNVCILDNDGNVYIGNIPYAQYVFNGILEPIKVQKIEHPKLKNHQIIQLQWNNSALLLLSNKGVIFRYFIRSNYLDDHFEIEHSIIFNEQRKIFLDNVFHMTYDTRCTTDDFPIIKTYRSNNYFTFGLDIYQKLHIKIGSSFQLIEEISNEKISRIDIEGNYLVASNSGNKYSRIYIISDDVFKPQNSNNIPLSIIQLDIHDEMFEQIENKIQEDNFKLLDIKLIQNTSNLLNPRYYLYIMDNEHNIYYSKLNFTKIFGSEIESITFKRIV